jgi:hypothetical protein
MRYDVFLGLWSICEFNLLMMVILGCSALCFENLKQICDKIILLVVNWWFMGLLFGALHRLNANIFLFGTNAKSVRLYWSQCKFSSWE